MPTGFGAPTVRVARQPAIVRYGVAISSSLIAAVVRMALTPLFSDKFPLITFYPALMLSGWFGGLWPGIVSTLASALIAEYFWIDPIGSFRVSQPGDLVALVLFVAIGTVISALNDLRQRGEAREREARERAERTQEEALRLAGDVRAAQQRVSALVASIPGVVWEAWGQPDAANQRIDFVSEYVEALLGYSVDDWLRTPNFWLTIVHPEDRDAAARVAHDAFAAGEPHINCFRWIRKNGDVVWVEAYAMVIHDDGGRPIGMRGVTLDITERHEAEAAERLAKREAEDANRMKDRFLAMVSHEMRAPLNAVLGWADMLRAGTLSDQRRARAIEAVYANAKRQARLIEDLLDISRMMSGRFRLQRAPVDFPAVIRAALDVVQRAAEDRRINIAVDADPTVRTLYADAARLQQVLWNLLSNAIKFTPEGGAVRARVRRVDNTVEVVVADTGRGIRPEFLPLVFEPFQQADTLSTRSHGGLGLGLAIVKHLVEAHGGRVSVESAGDGAGSTFTVRLPIVAVYDDQAPPAGEVASDAAPPTRVRPCVGDAIAFLRDVTVLIVDDDGDARELVAACLEDAGATVLAAETADEAMHLLQRTRVSALLSDISMPGSDGYALLRRVRASESPAIASLPVAALTSLTREEDRQHALEAGFQLHLAKPIDRAALVEAVVALVHSAVAP